MAAELQKADAAGGDAAGGDGASRAVACAEAAAALVSRRAAIVADATDEDPKSQPQLRRLEPREAPLVETRKLP